MSKKRKSYSASFKFQLVLEVLKGEQEAAEIARAHGVHPVSLSNWKKTFLENGSMVFGGSKAAKDHEQKVAQLERMVGQKEVEIAVLKNFLQRS